MSIRQELETLLSISQGTAEDYNEYILRVLEEINAIEDSIFNTMSIDTQNWVNDGILAYNGNQPIPDFPKTTIQVKVKPISVITPETVVEQGTKDTLEIIPEQVSLPEIEAEIRENTEDIGESILEQVSNEEMSNEEFRKQEDGLFNKSDILEKQINNSDIPIKKKRGRKPGTKNKPKVVIETQQTSDNTLVDVSATTVIPFGSEKSLTELVEDFSKDISDAEINEYPLVAHEYKFVEESMNMETGEITPVFELVKRVPDISAHRYIIAPDGSFVEVPLITSLPEPSKEEFIDETPDILYNTESTCSVVKEKPQKPLDLFRTLVCQNHDKPFGEIFKLAENQSIATKKPTALVICSQIKATINTLKNLGMLKEK